MARKKGDRTATAEDLRKFRRLINKGYSIRAAALEMGFSEKWGYTHAKADDRKARQRDQQGPPPKSWDELEALPQECLEDFNVFQEVFFAVDPVPWQKAAAEEVVERLVARRDKPREEWLKYFGVMNMPPGSGKSSLFTFRIPAWLICGGGFLDPQKGRALRLILGHEVETQSKTYVGQLKRFFELKRPHYDHKLERAAQLVPAEAFGRFKPESTLGEHSLWRADEFVVAQVGEHEIYNKEPTVQAASYHKGFLGARADYYVWDDLVTSKTANTAEASEQLAKWFEDEAEERLEPGGVGLLVGQRLGRLDLYANRIASTWRDEDGTELKRYFHIIYPAHNEGTCDAESGGSHRQWDGHDDGCLLDAKRLSWRDLLQKMERPNFRTVYQQEDSNLEDMLVRSAWLTGGTDEEGHYSEGCFDNDRGFFEWPKIKGLIDYVTVDPSVSGWWVFKWEAVDPQPPHYRYLIYGARRKMLASNFLDWDAQNNVFVGMLEDLQRQSGDLGHPIRMWIVEANSAHKYLFQMDHFRRWRQKWQMVNVIAHETQRNKTDPKMGVQALLPGVYRMGLKRIPYKAGTEHRNFVNQLKHELMNWPMARTDDIVMADWFGEYNMAKILQVGKYLNDDTFNMPNPNLSLHILSQQVVTDWRNPEPVYAADKLFGTRPVG